MMCIMMNFFLFLSLTNVHVHAFTSTQSLRINKFANIRSFNNYHDDDGIVLRTSSATMVNRRYKILPSHSHGHDYNLDDSPEQPQPIQEQHDHNRRSFLTTTLPAVATMTSLTLTNNQIANAASPSASIPSIPSIPTTAATSFQMENGLLESRVVENLLSAPTYGMESSDVFYPGWMDGTWKVESTTTDVCAPCGPLLFGGNATYNRARNEIGTTLVYKARFIPSATITTAATTTTTATTTATSSTSSTTIPKITSIADREYNVREIAKAAMGPNSVLDVPYVSPNKLTCLLTPNGAGSILQADLLTLARRQEVIDSNNEFHCSEVVRQIIAPTSSSSSSYTTPSSNPMGATRGATLLKEIETVSLYTAIRDDASNNIVGFKCRQRSATFLLPSQQDPMALQMWQMSRGRPIDVRFYNVLYKR